MKRATAICRVPRRFAALVLLVTWSIGSAWDVSHAAEHAFEHVDSEHHATLDHECQATAEVAVTGGDRGHHHPNEDSVLSTAKPRFESAAAITLTARNPSAALLPCLLQSDGEVSARASPDASGASGPRAPPIS